MSSEPILTALIMRRLCREGMVATLPPALTTHAKAAQPTKGELPMPLGRYMAEPRRGYGCTTRLFKSFAVWR
jgi:hypothetical protein